MRSAHPGAAYRNSRVTLERRSAAAGLADRRQVPSIPTPSIWSGTISFGLIVIPVKLYTAVRHKGVSFNQLDDRNMGRIRYQKVSEQTGDEVADKIVKGYEITSGRYVIFDPDDLNRLSRRTPGRSSSKSSSTSTKSTPSTSRSPTRRAAPQPEALRAARSGARVVRQVAIARFVIRGRQYTAAIRADNAASYVHPRLHRRDRPRRQGRRAQRPRRRRRRRPRGEDGPDARRVPHRQLRPRQVPRRLPGPSPRPHQPQGRRRRVRTPRRHRRAPQDRRHDGRPRSQRRSRQAARKRHPTARPAPVAGAAKKTATRPKAAKPRAKKTA